VVKKYKSYQFQSLMVWALVKGWGERQLTL